VRFLVVLGFVLANVDLHSALLICVLQAHHTLLNLHEDEQHHLQRVEVNVLWFLVAQVAA
jgi:hypothetical protein